MKKTFLAATSAALLAGALALPAAAQNIAIVNGKPVPKARLTALEEQIKAQAERTGRPVPPEIATQLRQELIAREIFMQEAQRRGLEASADYRAKMELARQSVLIGELFADYQKKNPVTDAEAKAEYDRLVGAQTPPAGAKEYKARHILVQKEEDAKAIVDNLKKGAKFEELAKQSIDPGSKDNGGDLGWASAGNFVKPFADALTALAKGKFTETPVKTDFGYHVILLDDSRPLSAPSFEEVKPRLQQQAQQQQIGKLVDSLRAKAKVSD